MSCLTFAYSLPYKMSGSIQVFQKDLRTQQDRLVRQVSGNHGERWESTFVQFYPSSDPYLVIIEGSYSGEPGSIVDIDDIHFIEGICDGFVTTPLPTTPTTTPTMPPMSIRETPSCQPTYAHLENDLSCDFATNFCKYSQVQSKLMWERWSTANGGWLGKVPAKSDNSSYLTTNLSNWMVRNKTAVLKSPEISLKTVCLEVWYSLPLTKSNLRIDIETSWGHTENLFNMEKSIKRGTWTNQSFIISHSADYKLLFSTTKIVSSSLVGLDDIKVYSKELTTAGTTPVLSTTQTTSANVTPISEKTSEMVTATTTKLTPTSTTVTSTSAKVTSTSMRATPTSTKITPTSTKVTPTTTKVTPTTTKAMPTTRQVTPTTRKVMPTTTNVASTSSMMTEHVTNKTTVVIKSSPSPSTTTPTSVSSQELSTTVPKSSSTRATTQHGTGLSSEKVVITTPSSGSASSSRITPTPGFSTSSTTIASPVKKTTKIDLTKSTSIKPITTKKTDDNKETTKIYEPTKKGQNVETKGEMNKSEETLSKGTKAGIGVAVSLVGIGVIIAIFLVLKNKKIKTYSIATTQEDNNACALQMVKLNN